MNTPLPYSQTKETIFKLKLVGSLLKFASLLIIAQVLMIAKNLKVLIFLYLFLFIQALLIIFFPSFPPSANQSKIISQKIEPIINQQRVSAHTIIGNKDELQQVLNSYQTKQLQPGLISYSYRDILINSALLNLALGNQAQFEQLIQEAKKIDPNWIGWN